MTVSVLMPVYNTKAEHLKESIESVLNQTYQDFELLIVDNESDSRDTLETISQYANNDKVNIIKCERQSGKKNLSVALNLGLEAAKNELVARIDSDDTMLPERLDIQVKYMNEHPEISVVGGQMIHTSDLEHTTNLPEVIHEFYYFTNTHILNHPTAMFRKSHVLEVGGYPDTPDQIPEDFLLWTKMLQSGYKIRNLKETIVVYRDDAYGLSMIDSSNENWNKAIASVIYS